MSLPLALTRVDVGNYLLTLIEVYTILIFIRILLYWIPRIPYNRYLDIFLTFLRDVTDPYLNLFRRFVPMVRLGPAGLDLSPIIAIIVLQLVGTFVANAIQG